MLNINAGYFGLCRLFNLLHYISKQYSVDNHTASNNEQRRQVQSKKNAAETRHDQYYHNVEQEGQHPLTGQRAAKVRYVEVNVA